MFLQCRSITVEAERLNLHTNIFSYVFIFVNNNHIFCVFLLKLILFMFSFKKLNYLWLSIYILSRFHRKQCSRKTFSVCLFRQLTSSKSSQPWPAAACRLLSVEKTINEAPVFIMRHSGAAWSREAVAQLQLRAASAHQRWSFWKFPDKQREFCSRVGLCSCGATSRKITLTRENGVKTPDFHQTLRFLHKTQLLLQMKCLQKSSEVIAWRR